MLLDQDALRQRLHGVIVPDWNRRLHDNRPRVELGAHEVDGGARYTHAVLEGLALGVKTGERRKKRRVDIQNPVGKRMEERWPDDAHVPRKADEIDAARAEHLDDRAIVGVSIRVVTWSLVERFYTRGTSAHQPWSIRTIRDDDRNRRIERAGSNRIDD